MYSFYDTQTAIGKFFSSKILVNAVMIAFLIGTVCCFSATASAVTVIKDGEQTVVYSSKPNPNADTLLTSSNVDVNEGEEYEMIEIDGHLIMKIGKRTIANVNYNGKTQKISIIFTGTETVADVLARSSFVFPENTLVTPSEDTLVENDLTITVGVVTKGQITVNEEIPFDVKYEDTSKLMKGITNVSVKGKNGLSTKVYNTSMVDGVVVSKELVSETVITEPITQVVSRGTTVVSYKKGSVKNAVFNSASTHPVTSDASINKRLVSPLAPDQPIQLNANGVPVSYKTCITGIASAYCPEDGAWTATGAPAQLGYIAVNPKQIPYGTLMYIKCRDNSYIYGYAIAADCGGFTSMGRTVDLFFPSRSAAYQFGLRNVEIYIL